MFKKKKGLIEEEIDYVNEYLSEITFNNRDLCFEKNSEDIDQFTNCFMRTYMPLIGMETYFATGIAYADIYYKTCMRKKKHHDFCKDTLKQSVKDYFSIILARIPDESQNFN